MKTALIQEKRCPLCHRIGQTGMNKNPNYWFCKNCELGWIKKIPVTTYTDTYYASGSSFLASIYKPMEALFYKIRELHTGFLKKSLYIDVGAGDGNFIDSVNARKKIGVEISLSGRNAMKEKGLTTLTNNAFLKSKKFNADVISFWQVLEHVSKPWEYIKVAEKNIKKSGKIIIAVPNISSFESMLFGKYWFHLAPKFHVWHFSPKSITKMLAQSNLKVDYIDYWAIEHHPTGILQTFINYTSQSEDILHKLVKRRQNFDEIKPKYIFWIILWCTVGLPLIILFWIFSSISRRSGNITIVASKK